MQTVTMSRELYDEVIKLLGYAELEAGRERVNKCIDAIRDQNAFLWDEYNEAERQKNSERLNWLSWIRRHLNHSFFIHHAHGSYEPVTVIGEGNILGYARVKSRYGRHTTDEVLIKRLQQQPADWIIWPQSFVDAVDYMRRKYIYQILNKQLKQSILMELTALVEHYKAIGLLDDCVKVTISGNVFSVEDPTRPAIQLTLSSDSEQS